MGGGQGAGVQVDQGGEGQGAGVQVDQGVWGWGGGRGLVYR